MVFIGSLFKMNTQMEKNVLVVDDSYIIRTVILKAIKLSGLPFGEVYQAENGKLALDTLREKSIDIIFSDIHMPVMDGLTLFQEAQAENLLGKVPFIVISTEGSELIINQFKNLGTRAFIRKPFTPEYLVSVLKTHFPY